VKRFGLTPLLVLAAIATAMLVGARFTPYFPGDVELAQFIQRIAPPGEWARAVTRAAYVPWVYGVLAVSAIAALRVAGWRGAAAMAVTFFAMMHAEPYIKNHIARPRPSADLVAGGSVAPMVSMTMSAQAAPSYGMPSGWGLLFGASAGLLGVLAWRNARGTVRAAYTIGCGIVLLAGVIARVSLGQHWPSDVIAGYLLAITIGLAVFEALAAVAKGEGQRAKGTGRQG
jgi:undecaprenyl-diphosphatase